MAVKTISWVLFNIHKKKTLPDKTGLLTTVIVDGSLPPPSKSSRSRRRFWSRSRSSFRFDLTSWISCHASAMALARSLLSMYSNCHHYHRKPSRSCYSINSFQNKTLDGVAVVVFATRSGSKRSLHPLVRVSFSNLLIGRSVFNMSYQYDTVTQVGHGRTVLL